MTTGYGNHYRYAPSPGRVELKAIAMEEQHVSQEIQIYDGSEVVQNGGAQGQLASDNHTMEQKLHYTNLDASYITAEHYQSYVPPAGNSGKDYIFGPNVLYKGEQTLYFILSFTLYSLICHRHCPGQSPPTVCVHSDNHGPVDIRVNCTRKRPFTSWPAQIPPERAILPSIRRLHGEYNPRH